MDEPRDPIDDPKYPAAPVARRMNIGANVADLGNTLRCPWKLSTDTEEFP